jgi:hypothetical protein
MTAKRSKSRLKKIRWYIAMTPDLKLENVKYLLMRHSLLM